MKFIINYLLSLFGVDKLINYLKPSIEDDTTKQASAKRLTALMICSLYAVGHYHVFQTNTDSDLLFKVMVLDAVFILVLFGIVTTQNLLTAFNSTKITQKTDENNTK